MASKAKSTQEKTENIKAVLARLDDGTIQITYTIAPTLVEKERLHAAEELGRDIEIPGFRRGKAPIEKVIDRIAPEKLTQHLLSHILPQAFGDTIEKEKLRPIIYPKFELLKAEVGKEWEVRATTAELPEINLGDYKKKLTGALKAQGIWTPDKADKNEDKKEPNQAEKEAHVIKILLEEVQVTIPKFLVEDEINNRLSQLLERIEKLGLTLESYLASIGKTPDTIRTEYAQTAADTLKIDFILSKISQEEKITPDTKDINQAIEALSADPKMKDRYNSPDQRRMIESIIIKRKTLDNLIALL